MVQKGVQFPLSRNKNVSHLLISNELWWQHTKFDHNRYRVSPRQLPGLPTITVNFMFPRLKFVYTPKICTFRTKMSMCSVGRFIMFSQTSFWLHYNHYGSKSGINFPPQSPYPYDNCFKRKRHIWIRYEKSPYCFSWIVFIHDCPLFEKTN